MYIVEKERKVDIFDSCDVFVAGGGIAGVSAALSAARTGAKVILAEKQCILGGLATAGLVLRIIGVVFGAIGLVCTICASAAVCAAGAGQLGRNPRLPVHPAAGGLALVRRTRKLDF